MRFLLKTLASLLGIAFLAVALLFLVVNLTDEELSPASLAAMNVPPPPAPDPSNGYIDFLGLTAPEGQSAYEAGLVQLRLFNEGAPSEDPRRLSSKVADPQIPNCNLFATRCMQVAAEPQLRELLDRHRLFLQRYRAMREKEAFINLEVRPSLLSLDPGYGLLSHSQRAVLLEAAMQFRAGNREDVIGELEKEFEFYRKVAIGARTVLPKRVAFVRMDKLALFAVELGRELTAGDPLLTRLAALPRAPTKAESDVSGVLRVDRAWRISMMRKLSFVRESVEEVRTLRREFGRQVDAPWWEGAVLAGMSRLYRPNQTINLYVAQTDLMLSAANVPAPRLLAEAEELRGRASAMDPGLQFLNLGGALISDGSIGDIRPIDFLASVQGAVGVQALCHLYLRLRADGITSNVEIAKALAGPIGTEHANPFTGKPMRFDPARRVLVFDVAKEHVSSLARDGFRNGGVELPL